MGVNIVVLAQSNQTNLDNTYNTIISSKSVTQDIKDFVKYLNENLKASVNSEHQKFVNIIRDRVYLSSFEFTGDYAKAIEHYGGRKAYRMIIDDYFNDGKAFKYFALNSGNMGTPIWGPYCIVLEINYFASDFSAILKRNSLDKDVKGKYYYFNGNSLNETLFTRDLATTKDATKLSLVKHYKNKLLLSKNDWNEVVCKCIDVKSHANTDYIELITHQRCVLDNNFVVRMKKDRISTISKSSRKNKRGIKVKGIDILKNEFEEIKKLTTEFKLKFELV